MKAEAVTIRDLLENRCRYCVPIYQRHYVWDRKNQWEPFWLDILTKTNEVLQNRPQRFFHFMGAVVLETRKTSSVKQVTSFQVVDGQQRLTTFQLFLVAIKHYALEREFKDTVAMMDNFLLNGNEEIMANPNIEKYKVWPTQYDRELFQTIISGERNDLRDRYKDYFYKTKDSIRKNIPLKLLEAYGYFYDQIKQAVETDEVLGDDHFDLFDNKELLVSEENSFNRDKIEQRLEKLWVSLIEEFKIVQIVLEKEDDAQVIFETLNSRGKDLLAADLVRNYIFQRADALEENADKLFEDYWEYFEDTFWSVQGKQGRYKKDRIEFFIANFISAKISGEVTISKLFSEYKAYIHSQDRKPYCGYPSVEAELKDLCAYGKLYRRLIEPKFGDPLGKFSKQLKIWDVTTIYPLVLRIWAEDELMEKDKIKCLEMLLILIVRRAICNLTPKNYNKFFIYVLRHLETNGFSPEILSSYLTNQTGDSSRFPTDKEFKQAWLEKPVYSNLSSQRVRTVLESIELKKRNHFQETDKLAENLTVEHILPQSWYENWPLPSGEYATLDDLYGTNYYLYRRYGVSDSKYEEIEERKRLLQTFGNLTLLTQHLNSSISCGPYSEKRQALDDQSLLLLNREIVKFENWGENQIEERGKNLFEDALQLWPYPIDVNNRLELSH